MKPHVLWMNIFYICPCLYTYNICTLVLLFSDIFEIQQYVTGIKLCILLSSMTVEMLLRN